MSLSVLSSTPEPTAEQILQRNKDLKSFDANKFGNDTELERMWAVKAFRHTQVYYKLICGINCTKLRLTKFDDELYEQFVTAFPRVKIDVINEDKLKSVAAKRRWRNFCQLFEYHVEDYNFGTLLRLDCKEGYSEYNTTLVPRVQFLAIEIARNRQGLNMCHFGRDPNPKRAEDQTSMEESEKESAKNGNVEVEKGKDDGPPTA